MKHMKLTKHSIVLGFTSLVLASSLAVPGPLMAQGPQPPTLHPYGKVWEERRPSVFAKQEAQPESSLAPAALQPSSFANEHRMVFESYRDGQYEIYAADGDGNGAVKLTTSGLNRFPKLRYGAITTAYTYGSAGSRDLRAVRKDGSEQTTLSGLQGFSDVAWSPDGTKLAYARRGTTTDVYVSSFDFVANAISSEVCLTCGSGRSNFEPSWSPDGKQLIFVKASATEPKGALWRMNADGTGLQQLTGEQWWIADVRWSPDGTQVAFDYAPSRDAWQRLGALTLATGKIREVYNPNQNQVDAWMGSWSPDSQMLFFTRVEYVEQNGQLYIGKSWIERVNATGGGRTRLPGNSGLDAMPSVQKRDLVAPQSTIPTLATYSKINSFDLQAVASDPADTGLARLNLEMRDLTANSPWMPYTKTLLVSNRTFAFRSQAVDLEGNVEPIHAASEGDTKTTFYFWDVVGSFTDNRGFPVPNVRAISEPPAVYTESLRLSSSFAWKLATEVNQAFSISKPGYHSFRIAPFNATSDSALNSYLWAEDALLSEDFDMPLSNRWVVSGSLGANVTKQSAHSGVSGLEMQLSKSKTIDVPDKGYEGGSFLVDRSETVHWLQSDGYTIYYASNSSGWPVSPTVILSGYQITMRHIMPDEAGGVYIVFGLPNAQISVCHKVLAQPTCQPVLLDEQAFAPSADGVVDTNGTAHLVWNSNGEIRYTQRPPNGNWSTPINIADSYGVRPLIAVDGTGGLHVAYRADWTWKYVGKPAAGAWSAPSVLVGENPQCGYPAFLASTVQGTVHFLLNLCGTTVQHTKFYTDSGWTQSPAPSGNSIYFGVNATDDLYLITSNGPSGVLWTKLSDQSDWTSTSLTGYEQVFINQEGRVYLLRKGVTNGRELFHYDARVLRDFVAPSISASMFISPTLHRPTLAFMYRVAGNELTLSKLGLRIESSTHAVTDSLQLRTPNWVLVTKALNSFAGEVVTFTLSTVVADATSDRIVFVDDFSVSEWKTPIPTTVSVNRVDVFSPAQAIVITGTNFLDAPVIKLNNIISLQDVVWESDTQLRATLPANLPLGIYDLWIANPQGYEGTLPNAIAVGKLSYLPITFR